MTQPASEPLALLSFKLLVRDLYISPESLEYIQEVGEGEFALVEKGALSTKAGERLIVAVKSFKPYVVGTAEELRELVVAASLLNRLHHRHVAGFHGVGCFSTSSFEAVRASVFFVEEFIGGYTLQKLLTEQMRNPYVKLYKTQLALRWCIQLAEALEYLHSTNPVTIHADVKSQNVILTDEKLPDAEVRLADLKPHKHVYAKAPASPQAARPELPQASLMLCRTFRRAPGDLQDDSAHRRAATAAPALPRAASLPMPDTTTAPQPRHASTTDLDSAAGSPASDCDSPLPLAASHPDLLEAHAVALGKSAKPSSAPASPSSPHPAAAAAATSPQPPLASPFAAPATLPDTLPPADQSPSAAPTDAPHSLRTGNDPLQTAEAGPTINTAAPTHHATTHTMADLSGSGHSRGNYRPPHQQHTTEAEAAQPAARHQMECKQHGASQAFHALKAIHIISEEASSASNILPPAANPSVSGRRVRFSQAPPQGKTPSRAWGRLYMAPEMVRGQKYNEKVDVFSFGVVMYELLQRSLIIGWVDPSMDAGVSLVRYAEKVAEGHREPLPKVWPAELKELVSSCWHPDPHLRPRMAEVVATLKRLAATPALSDALDNVRVMPPEYTEPFCKCVIS